VGESQKLSYLFYHSNGQAKLLETARM